MPTRVIVLSMKRAVKKGKSEDVPFFRSLD